MGGGLFFPLAVGTLIVTVMSQFSDNEVEGSS
jgi:hypothetical protein